MMLRRWLLGWVLLALVAGQSLGFVHRIAHGPHTAAAHAATPEAGNAGTHAGWTEALFAGHDGDNDCRLFDGLGLDLLPTAAGAALLALPAPAILPPAATGLPARCTAPYEARGPPLPR